MTNAPSEPPVPPHDRILSKYVLSGATGMIGACATLIGLVKLKEPLGGLSRVDEAASITAVAFLISAFLAYLALRTRSRPRLQRRLEACADIIFLGAMTAIALVGVTFAFDLI